MGIKTVGQIAREYQVHPVPVMQWKGVIRDHLPELFESPQAAGEDHQQLIAQLHEKIGQLSVEVDWLKKEHRFLFSIGWCGQDGMMASGMEAGPRLDELALQK